MGKILIKGAVKRQKGCMYYIDGAGNVCEAKMARGGSKKKKAVKKVAPKKAVKKVAAKKKTALKKKTRK
jgi:hypothetical protein